MILTTFLYRLACFLTLVFLVAPLIAVWPLAFNSSSFLGYPLEDVTWRWFAAVLSDERWLTGAYNSLRIAAVSTLLAVALGGAAALGTSLSNRAMQMVMGALFVSPIVIPTVVIGLAIAYAFGRIGFTGGLVPLAIAHSVLAAPLVFISVLTSLKGIPESIDQAGASLGASRSYRFFTLTLPLSLPGFAAGALFAFMTSFDEVVVTLFIAEPGSTTLPVMLFSGLRDKLEPSIIAISLMLSVISLLFLCAMSWLQARSKFGSVGN